MSDAIRLTVIEDTPISLAVGEADPIARREIAELQEDVAELQGDVSDLQGDVSTLEGAVTTLQSDMSSVQGDVTELQEDVADIEERLDDAVQPDGVYPALTSGAALSLTSPTTAESTWARRATDAVDGVAAVDAILGNTIVQDGELLSVNLTGVESVGFNQWDEQWELGEYAGDGSKRARSNAIRSAGFIPCLPSTEYRWTCTSHSSSDGVLNFYDADKTFISRLVGALNYTVTPPANARYMTFYIAPETTYNHDICINLSNPALNGTYRPYATYQRSIPAATYFPNGMRSAGTVHDELTSDAAIVRVGAVDLGTLEWTYNSERAEFYALLSDRAAVNSDRTNLGECSGYPVSYVTSASAMSTAADDTLYFQTGDTNKTIHVKDTTYTDAAAFKAAMSGVMLHYALATPTTTPIDPPLTMTYRVQQGGTESVMHTDPTAAPSWRTRYPLDLAATVMANVAPVEQAVATANHAIGDLLCIGWQLYRVTRAIATGERITQGTNVTPTTVAAEIAAIQ